MAGPKAADAPAGTESPAQVAPDRQGPMPHDHADFSPIFVIGFPRSGTTLLATILSRHSRIAAPPETRFLEEVADGATDRSAMLARAFGNRRCQDLGLDAETVAARFSDRPATYDWLFRIMLETYAADAGKELVAEKSPVHLLHMPALIQWYPKARFLVLARDGRDCVLSLLKTPWAHNSLLRHSAEWRRRMRRVRQIRDALGKSVHIVRYEDLVLTPEIELRKVMAFLDLAFEDDQLRPTAASSAVPDWEKGWKGKAVDRPDPGRIAAWKREAEPGALLTMESVMRGELAAWGYETENRRRRPGAAIAGVILASESYRRLQTLLRTLRAPLSR